MSAGAAVAPAAALSGGLRALALGGVVGPVCFVAAWWSAGRSASHYSAIDDAISRLAATGAPTRAVMTAGFVAFAVGVGTWAPALRAAIGGPAWIAAAGTAVCTLAVAAFPLDRSPATDDAHAVSAVLGYATLAAIPLLAAGQLAARGYTGWARASRLTGVASAMLLTASFVGPANGLFQRAGLTVTDVWIVVTSLRLVCLGAAVTATSEPPSAGRRGSRRTATGGRSGGR